MFGGLRRAGAVVRDSWKEDKKRPKVRRKRDELEFLPAAVEVLETPASPIGRTVAILICVIFLVAIAWGWFGHIDTVAVAQGKIIPTERVKYIQPVDIGIVRAIHVEDGQMVDEGDVLIELDPTEQGADLDRLQQDLIAARTDVARLQAQVAEEETLEGAFVPPDGADAALVATAKALLTASRSELRSSLAAIDEEIAQRAAERATSLARIERLDATIPLLKKRVEAYRYLVKREVGRRLVLFELEEQLVGQERDRITERRRQQEIAAAVKVLRERRAERLAASAAAAHTELRDALQRSAGLAQEIKKARERKSRRALRAPVTGTVQQLQIHTVGGVVSPAEKIMAIVPADSRLEVEAMVLNKDIGFVSSGQVAELKVDSFPFTKYGVIDGEVMHISADAVPDEQQGLVFPAKVGMQSERILVGDKWVSLAPGMSVTVEIKTGNRRAIDFFLSPFLEYQDEALRER